MNLEQAWYSDKKWVWLLLPLTVMFWAISRFRKFLYKYGLKKVNKSSLPLIVVGNITVGGTGKTPFVIYLAELLKKQGFSPAIVSRGYGANTKIGPSFPRLVNQISDPSLTGDEPNLLAMRTECPVIIDSNRSVAVKYASQISGIDIVISDDGLQHYAMDRQLEIVLVDGQRQFGNGYLLPMGPLRENVDRLQEVDITVINSGFVAKPTSRLLPDYRLEANSLIQLVSGDVIALKAEKRNVHLVSGIGNPERFKQTAVMSGLNVVNEIWHPDHHNFREADFSVFDSLKSDTDIIVMTEKDAIKCKRFAKKNWYVLPIDAVISESLETVILEKLKQKTNG